VILARIKNMIITEKALKTIALLAIGLDWVIQGSLLTKLYGIIVRITGRLKAKSKEGV
jgi:hypothetical protein